MILALLAILAVPPGFTQQTPALVDGVDAIGITVSDMDRAIDFYSRILGLTVMGKEAGRHVFFQVGESNVFLVFNPQTTSIGDKLPPHGAGGQVISHWESNSNHWMAGVST